MWFGRTGKTVLVSPAPIKVEPNKDRDHFWTGFGIGIKLGKKALNFN
jgi:hypothetical protein